MKKVFADTGYWIAVVNPHDDLHNKALQISGSLGPHLIVTSEMILTLTFNRNRFELPDITFAVD